MTEKDPLTLANIRNGRLVKKMEKLRKQRDHWKERTEFFNEVLRYYPYARSSHERYEVLKKQREELEMLRKRVKEQELLIPRMQKELENKS